MGVRSGGVRRAQGIKREPRTKEKIQNRGLGVPGTALVTTPARAAVDFSHQPERGKYTRTRDSQQWYPEHQHRDVPAGDDHQRKQVAMLCDIRLLSLQNVAGQREVKSVGRAEQQMKPNEVRLPIPDKVANDEDRDDYRRVHGKEIRRERDEKIILRDDDVAALGGIP